MKITERGMYRRSQFGAFQITVELGWKNRFLRMGHSLNKTEPIDL